MYFVREAPKFLKARFLKVPQSAVPQSAAKRGQSADRARALSTLREPVIGVMSGSTRRGSLNQKLATFAASEIAKLGATVEEIPLDGPHELPLFSQDLEETFPPKAVALKEAMERCDAWLIAGPEYNGGMTPFFAVSSLFGQSRRPFLKL